jgi:hypothetical protein
MLFNAPILIDFDSFHCTIILMHSAPFRYVRSSIIRFKRFTFTFSFPFPSPTPLDEDGSMESCLPLESFMKDLYTVVEHTKKPELLVAAMRFSDADGMISIPEFINFLATPSEVGLLYTSGSFCRRLGMLWAIASHLLLFNSS